MRSFTEGLPLDRPAVVIPWVGKPPAFAGPGTPPAVPEPGRTVSQSFGTVTLCGVTGSLRLVLVADEERKRLRILDAELTVGSAQQRSPAVISAVREVLGDPAFSEPSDHDEDDIDTWAVGPAVLEHHAGAYEGPGGEWGCESLVLHHDPQAASTVPLRAAIRAMQPYWDDAARIAADPDGHREAQARLVLTLGEATLLIPRKPLDDGSPPVADTPGMVGAGVRDDATGDPAVVACTSRDAVARWAKRQFWPTFEIAGTRAVEVAASGGTGLLIDPDTNHRWWLDGATAGTILQLWASLTAPVETVDLSRAHLSDAQSQAPRLIAWLRQAMPGFPAVVHAVVLDADDGMRRVRVCGLWVDQTLTAEEGDQVAAQVALAVGRALERDEVIDVVRLHGSLLDRAQQAVAGPAYSRAE